MLCLAFLLLIVIGFDEEFALTGPLGDAFTVWKDLVEVGVLLAVGYAFYRRLLLKPARLEPNREGLLVLGLIMTPIIVGVMLAARVPEAQTTITRRVGSRPALWRGLAQAPEPL